jgi:hypothetical protein
VLLSLFLSVTPDELLSDRKSCKILSNAMTSIVICVSTVLKSGLTLKSNCEGFQSQMKLSHFTPLVRIFKNVADLIPILCCDGFVD